jgi:hypothetical protein
MDVFSWFDIPFWQKLFKLGLFGGILFFMLEIQSLMKNWREKLTSFINDCRTNYRNDIKKWRH